MKKTIIIVILVTIVLFVFLTIKMCVRTKNDIYKILDEDVYSIELENEVKIEKDSIDTLIEIRVNQKFNSTIFANLKFGDSPQKVEQAMRNTKYRKIQVPYEELVSVVEILDWDAEYYDNQLAVLTLYSEDEYLYNALGIVYATKYGKTKGNKWHFSNCSIEIVYGGRSIYDPSGDAGYNRTGGPILYYCSYRGQRDGNCITQDGTFLKIIYKNHELLKQKELQEYITDSLNRIKQINEIKQEKELSKKISTEIATGI